MHFAMESKKFFFQIILLQAVLIVWKRQYYKFNNNNSLTIIMKNMGTILPLQIVVAILDELILSYQIAHFLSCGINFIILEYVGSFSKCSKIVTHSSIITIYIIFFSNCSIMDI